MMEYKRIGDLTTVITGGTPSTAKAQYWDGGNIPWLQSGCCQNCDVTGAEKYITKVGYDNSSTKMMPPETVMIALTGATAGKVGYLRLEACGNQSITGILPCKTLNQRFLFYYLLSQREKILFDCIGGAQPHISQRYVKSILVPMFPLEEQGRIVANLEKIASIIEKRKKQICTLDKLIKARFVEMFGDPELNPKGWNKDTLKNHAEVFVGYPFPSDGYSQEGINIVGGYNLMQGYVIWEDSKHWPEEAGYEQYLLQANDIVMAMDRPWVNGGFKIARIDESHLPALLIQRTACIRSRNLQQEFLHILLDSNRFADHCNITGSLVPHISNKDINSFQVILPPMELQRQFTAFVNQVDKSKIAIQKSLDETQVLFDSLMQKYFG